MNHRTHIKQGKTKAKRVPAVDASDPDGSQFKAGVEKRALDKFHKKADAEFLKQARIKPEPDATA
jgi:hypothetical protein